jgi:hypothetical protein
MFRRRRLSADRLSRATAAVEDKQFAGSVCIWAGMYMGCGPLPGWALGLCTYGTPPEPGLSLVDVLPPSHKQSAKCNL